MKKMRFTAIILAMALVVGTAVQASAINNSPSAAGVFLYQNIVAENIVDETSPETSSTSPVEETSETTESTQTETETVSEETSSTDPTEIETETEPTETVTVTETTTETETVATETITETDTETNSNTETETVTETVTESETYTETVTETETTTETITETVTETETETETEIIPPAPKTKIKVYYTKDNKKINLNNGDTRQVYRGAKYKFKLEVENKVGKIKVTSNKTKVASVKVKGNVITANAKKAGTASVTVKNNSAKIKFKIKVINPTLKKSSKTLNIKDTYIIKIKGQKGKKNFKSSNKKILRVNKNGKVKAVGSGDAKITVKTNGGYKLTFTAHVNGKLDSRINRIIKSKDFIQRTTIYTKNITVWCNAYNYVGTVKYDNGLEDEAAGVKALFTQENNLMRLYEDKYGWASLVKNYKKLEKIRNKLNKSTITSSDANILKVTKNGRIYGVDKGKAQITVKLRNKTFKVNADVIKPETYHFKSDGGWLPNGKFGKVDTTAKVVYNPEELYLFVRDTYLNNILKGEKPDYQYIICYFKNWNNNDYYDKVEKYLKNRAKADCLDASNYYELLQEENHTIFTNIIEESENNLNEFEIGTEKKYNVIKVDYEDKELTLKKKVYNKAKKIIEDYRIENETTTYDKIRLLAQWFRNEVEYKEPDYLSDCPDWTGLILKEYGVCHNYALATLYFCSLLKIPCIYLTSNNPGNITHAYNIAKCDDGKWYLIDILWCALFVGTDEKIDNNGYHLLKEDELKEYGLKISDISKETYYRYIEDFQSDEE